MTLFHLIHHKHQQYAFVHTQYLIVYLSTCFATFLPPKTTGKHIRLNVFHKLYDEIFLFHVN